MQLQLRARMNYFLTQLQPVSWVGLILYAVTVFPLCVIPGRGIFLLEFNTVSCSGGAATSVRFRTTQEAQDGTLGFR